MVEISEDTVSNISENIEKALKYMGKVMHCVSELEEDSRYSEMSERRYTSDRYNYKPYKDYDSMEERGYTHSGRYSRY